MWHVCMCLKSECFIWGLPFFISRVTQQEVHPIICVHEIVAVLARVVNKG